MLTATMRDRLTVVLVGARNPQNIGAAARAMQDFGFSDLRVVNTFAPPFEAAQLEARSAVRAEEVMRSARLFQALPEAIADCTLVAGTTAIGERGLRVPVQALHDAAPALLTHLRAGSPQSPASAPHEDPQSSSPHGSPLNGIGREFREEIRHAPEPKPQRVALLFGSEKTGLTNEQLSYCSRLVTIPLFAPEGRHLSMNLGQSVAVCLYELTRKGLEGARPLPVQDHGAATAADRERLTRTLLELMERSGYAGRFPANARRDVVRQLAHSLGQTHNDAGTWMGLLKQLLRFTEAQPAVTSPPTPPATAQAEQDDDSRRN